MKFVHKCGLGCPVQGFEVFARKKPVDGNVTAYQMPPLYCLYTNQQLVPLDN